MRNADTDSGVFRASLHELTTMVVYEAARTFATEQYPISTPVAPTQGIRLANPPLIVPVLRAGLGTAEFDESQTATHSWFIGYQGDVAFAAMVEKGGLGSEAAVPAIS